MEITLQTQVEDLVQAHPKAAGYLAEHHVVCIVCGEPYWGTLGELMAQKGVQDPEGLLEGLRDYLQAQAGAGG